MESIQITVTKNGENFGPYSLDELAVYIEEGHFGIDDLAWREGMTDWQPISKFLNVEFISELRQEILPKSEEAYPIPLVPSAPNTVPKLKSLSRFKLNRKFTVLIGSAAIVLFGLILWLSVTESANTNGKSRLSGVIHKFVYLSKATAPADDPYSQVVKKYWDSTYGERLQLIFRGDLYQKSFEERYGDLTKTGFEARKYTTLTIEPSADANFEAAKKAGWKGVTVNTTEISENGEEIKGWFFYCLQNRDGQIKIEWEANSSSTNDPWRGWEEELTPTNWQVNPLSIYAELDKNYSKEIETTSRTIIDNFPERIREKTVRLQGKFRGFSDIYIDYIPGVTSDSNGLTSLLNLKEKEKWLGFQLGDPDPGSYQSVDKVFAPKDTFADVFLTFSDDSSKGTPLDIVALALPLHRTGGDIGLFCLKVSAYNTWTGEWVTTTVPGRFAP